ncbi:hypothetical protein BZA05DRAFT_411478 [Tricharina praecox]|uniref:uncharacterized protein n=1 Tax=Tricharina praecox TaxID=43433 RepID=UPI00221F2E46|nr:uncharacterized protein BZA05DRAFT_411478 [Tricharina praecox]KAI5842802.1 hypothetical protein BZA05DRAFT_411478 [Tricharina praecox]
MCNERWASGRTYGHRQFAKVPIAPNTESTKATLFTVPFHPVDVLPPRPTAAQHTPPARTKSFQCDHHFPATFHHAYPLPRIGTVPDRTRRPHRNRSTRSRPRSSRSTPPPLSASASLPLSSSVVYGGRGRQTRPRRCPTPWHSLVTTIPWNEAPRKFALSKSSTHTWIGPMMRCCCCSGAVAATVMARVERMSARRRWRTCRRCIASCRVARGV